METTVYLSYAKTKHIFHVKKNDQINVGEGI